MNSVGLSVYFIICLKAVNLSSSSYGDTYEAGWKLAAKITAADAKKNSVFDTFYM